MRRIISNKAQCLRCGDIIESKHRHDFVWCSCRDENGEPNGIAVDGGRDYLKRMVMDKALLKDLSEEEVYFEGADDGD